MRRVSFVIKCNKDGWRVNPSNGTNASAVSSTVEPDFLVNCEVFQSNYAALVGFSQATCISTTLCSTEVAVSFSPKTRSITPSRR